MIRSYIVRVWCPHCGRVHRLSADFRLNDGPGRAGSVAELYDGRELPPKLQHLFDKKMRCTYSDEWVSLADRDRVFLLPRPAFGP
jgi:hypothetical protein